MLQAEELTLTYNARGALLETCEQISGSSGGEILVPAYHCPSAIMPTIQAGLRPVYYRIQRDLYIDERDLLSKVSQRTVAVLAIHFFGIEADLRFLTPLKQRGIRIIEDCSHSFLTGGGRRLAGGIGDFRIYSFWKLLPSITGGGLWREQQVADATRRRHAPLRARLTHGKHVFEAALENSRFQALKSFYGWLEGLRTGQSSHDRREPKASLGDTDAGPLDGLRLAGERYYPLDLTLAKSAMPTLARKIAEACDFVQISRKRRDNYLRYATRLSHASHLRVLRPTLSKDACPWVFPVLLDQRGELDVRWRAAGVALHTFGIYLHSSLAEHTDARTVADALFLADHILCLSIHQDLAFDDIDNSIAIIEDQAYLNARKESP